MGSDLPETFDAAYGCTLMKRLLLHHIVQPEALDLEKTPMQDVLTACGRETSLPWLLAAAISMCKVGLNGFYSNHSVLTSRTSILAWQTIHLSARLCGISCRGRLPGATDSTLHLQWQGLFLGIGEMRGLGLQHLHGMGFLMGRMMGKDGLPVWSGPSYLEIASSRSGVGAGEPPPNK